MKILAVDTSTPYGLVALGSGEEVVAEAGVRSLESHSSRLAPTIEFLLSAVDWSIEQIDLFGVVEGPGSFTGLRVGMATIKGLAWASQKPMVGLHALHLLAENARGLHDFIAPMLEARKERVFGGIFGWKGEELDTIYPVSDIDPATLVNQHKGKLLCLGPGATKYKEKIRQSCASVVFAPSWTDSPFGGAMLHHAQKQYQHGNVLNLRTSEPIYYGPNGMNLGPAEKML